MPKRYNFLRKRRRAMRQAILDCLFIRWTHTRLDDGAVIAQPSLWFTPFSDDDYPWGLHVMEPSPLTKSDVADCYPDYTAVKASVADYLLEAFLNLEKAREPSA